MAEGLCGGRLATLGGGGYHIVDVVPLAWTWALAELGGVVLGDEVPESWREHVRSRLACEPPTSMGEHDRLESPAGRDENVLALTAKAVRETRKAVFPYHSLAP